MRKVYSWQEKPKGEPSVTGNGKEPEYSYRIDENGIKTLEKTGEVDVYAQIQSYLEETKIENIIKRATYDPEAIGSQEWMKNETTDISNIPSNYHEWKRIVNKAEESFNTLPAELKAKFDNSVEKYIGEYGSESWAEKLGWKKQETTVTKQETTVTKKKEEQVNNEPKQ